MRFFIFSLMLAAAAHAITCTEGLLMYYSAMYSRFLSDNGAILDSTIETSLDGFSASEKFVREDDRILKIYRSNEEGTFKSDTSIYLYLVNDINSPADSSLAYKKSVIGDTTLVEAVINEHGSDAKPHMSIKTFKNGFIIDTFEDGQEFSYKEHLEFTLKNDTLFNLALLSEDGAPMDTSDYSFYVADKDDKHVCHEFYRIDYCPSESGCTTGDGKVYHDGDIVQSTDKTIKETESGFAVEGISFLAWIYQYFMSYTDDYVPASIAKRPAARMKQPSRDYYFDTKGRKQFKAIPYRVQF